MAIVGYGGGVYIAETKVAEITNWSLDMSADDIDVTSFDSEGWKENLQGLKEWSGSFEGNFAPDDATGQAELIDAWINGQKVTIKLQVNSTVSFSGDALVNPSIETPVDDKASFSCDFTGTGPLTPSLTSGL